MNEFKSEPRQDNGGAPQTAHGPHEPGLAQSGPNIATSLLHLQRTVGNQAMQRLIHATVPAPLAPTGPPTLQRQTSATAVRGGLAGRPAGAVTVRRLRPTVQRVLYPQIVERFKPGDLMYGLAMARADTGLQVIDKLKAVNSQGDQSAAVILDELNNYFLGTETANDDVGDDRSPYGQRQRFYDPSAQISYQAVLFKNWLQQHPRYSPILRDMRGLPLADKARVWARIKQTCKAGLEYTAGHGRGHIYFVLDDLDMNAVVKKLRYNKSNDPDFQAKLKVDPATGDSVKDITPAELRYLFRHRKDATMMSNVSFWFAGKQVTPPWVTDPALWRKYKPYSEKNAVEKFFSGRQR